MVPNTVFLWEKPVPEEWQTALRDAAPAGERLSNFQIVWEPGEPQAPIQRYVLWQMRPRENTRKMIVRGDPRVLGLTQEHPRKYAKWDAHLGCYRKWGGGFAATDLMTWKLYHETGQYGQRWWVIQGAHGGHRYDLTKVEQKILAMKSKRREVDVPLAGDLPYAEFDERVLRHLRKLESVARWQKVCAYADANEARLDAEEQKEAEESRRLMSDWLDEQFGAVFSEFSGVYRDTLREMPRPITTKDSRQPTSDDAQAQWREEYIRVGT